MPRTPKSKCPGTCPLDWSETTQQKYWVVETICKPDGVETAVLTACTDGSGREFARGLAAACSRARARLFKRVQAGQTARYGIYSSRREAEAALQAARK